MEHKLTEIPIEQLVVEHYLFDLGCPVEKVSEILDEDENHVKEIYKNHVRLTMPGMTNK